MTCPGCYAEFDTAPGACPECGMQLLSNVSGMMKTSTVMIAAAGECGFYRSVQEVPESLRRQLLKVTASENSGTIVIADKAGKEQLTQIVARREAGHRQVTKTSVQQPAVIHSVAGPPSFWELSWVVWAGILLLCGSTAVVAVVFGFHW